MSMSSMHRALVHSTFERHDNDSVDEEYVMTPLPATPERRGPTAATSHSWSTAAVLAGVADVAFRCDYDGVLGGSPSATTVFRIRVLHDGTLQGEELQFRTRTVMGAGNTVASNSSAKRPKLSTKAQLTATGAALPAPIVRARDEWVVTAHLEGRATPQRPHHRFHEPLQMDDTYCCYFDVLPVDTSTSRAFACHSHFTPHESRMSGHALCHADKPFWITPDAPCELLVQEIHREAFVWTKRGHASASVARPVVAAVKQEDASQAAAAARDASKQLEPPTTAAPVKSEANASRLTLYPLTPGLYEFRGFTTIAPPPRPANASQRRRRRRDSISPHDTPTKDECFVTLQLLPGGALEGTSRELLRPQSCPVKGKWRADRMQYVLTYKVRDAVGQFKYSGRIEGARKIIGRWANVDSDGLDAGYSGGRGDFELELTQAVRLNSAKTERTDAADATADNDDDDAAVRIVTNHKMRVLTTGAYTLKGCATDDDGYEYACELYVQLCSGGELIGTTRELVFDQTRRITGTWTPQSITYTQVYVVKGDVGEYIYTGSIDADGGILTGNWTNTNAKDSESPGERGTFAYGIAHAWRQWSCHSHVHYPQSFRTAVRLVLLCSSRTHALPHTLWCRVFEYCGAAWFA